MPDSGSPDNNPERLYAFARKVAREKAEAGNEAPMHSRRELIKSESISRGGLFSRQSTQVEWTVKETPMFSGWQIWNQPMFERWKRTTEQDYPSFGPVGSICHREENRLQVFLQPDGRIVETLWKFIYSDYVFQEGRKGARLGAGVDGNTILYTDLKPITHDTIESMDWHWELRKERGYVAPVWERWLNGERRRRKYPLEKWGLGLSLAVKSVRPTG